MRVLTLRLNASARSRRHGLGGRPRRLRQKEKPKRERERERNGKGNLVEEHAAQIVNPDTVWFPSALTSAPPGESCTSKRGTPFLYTLKKATRLTSSSVAS